MTTAEFDKEALDNIGDISSSYETVLDYLTTAEGGKLHRNSTESDITTGRGIYKAVNEGKVWDYVAAVAESIGISTDTKSWTKDDLNAVNEAINPTTMKYYEWLFYKDYYARIHIDKYPKSALVTISSIFANTEVGAVEATQYAIVMLHKLNPSYLNLDLSSMSDIDGNFIDGKFGNSTLVGLEAVCNASEEVQDMFNLLMTIYTMAYHAKLVAGNPSKYLEYLKGWMNRDLNMILSTIELLKGK